MQKNVENFIFSLEQSEFAFAGYGKFVFSFASYGEAIQDEKEFVVACEDKLTFLAEALPKQKMNFSKQSVEKL